MSLTSYLFLETAHGVLLWLAALSYARGPSYQGRPLALLLPVAIWAGVGPVVFGDAAALVAAQSFVLGGTALAALAVLWPLREPTGMGLRLLTNMLALLALFYFVQATGFAASARGAPVLRMFEAAPFGVLLLQMMLALGMVLAVMEAGQFAQATTMAQLRDAENKLKVLAETDPLTGCFNRRVFRDLVDDLRARAADTLGLVVLVDMDGLKTINDRRGHSAGDQAIRELADAIRGCTRATDLVVRWGGDEFVVVMPGVRPEDAEARLREIVDGVAEAGLSASAGSAVYGEGVDIMAAVDHADREMYSVKAARKAAQARA